MNQAWQLHHEAPIHFILFHSIPFPVHVRNHDCPAMSFSRILVLVNPGHPAPSSIAGPRLTAIQMVFTAARIVEDRPDGRSASRRFQLSRHSLTLFGEKGERTRERERGTEGQRDRDRASGGCRETDKMNWGRMQFLRLTRTRLHNVYFSILSYDIGVCLLHHLCERHLGKIHALLCRQVGEPPLDRTAHSGKAVHWQRDISNTASHYCNTLILLIIF